MSKNSTLPRGLEADSLFANIDQKYIRSFTFCNDILQFKDCPEESRTRVLLKIVAEATVWEIKNENEFIGMIDITSRLILLKEIPALLSSNLIILLSHIFDFKEFEHTQNYTEDEMAEMITMHLLPSLANEWDLIFVVRKISNFNNFSHKLGTLLTWGAICKFTSTKYKTLNKLKIEKVVGIIAKFYTDNKIDDNVDEYFVFLSLFSLLLSLIKFTQEMIDAKTYSFLISWCSTVETRIEFLKRYSNNSRDILLLSELVEFDIKHKVENFKVME